MDYFSAIFKNLILANEANYFIKFYEILKSRNIMLKEIPMLIDIDTDLSAANTTLYQKRNEISEIETIKYQTEQDVHHLSIAVEAIKSDYKKNLQSYLYYLDYSEKLKEEVKDLLDFINRIKEKKEYKEFLEIIREIVKEQFKDIRSLVYFVILEMMHFLSDSGRKDDFYLLMQYLNNLSQVDKRDAYGYSIHKDNLLQKNNTIELNYFSDTYSIREEIMKISDSILKALEEKNLLDSVRYLV